MRRAEIDALMKKPEAERTVIVRCGRTGMLRGTLVSVEYGKAQIRYPFDHKSTRPRSHALGLVLGVYEGDLRARYDADLDVARARHRRNEAIVRGLADIVASPADESIHVIGNDSEDEGRAFVSMSLKTAEDIIAAFARVREGSTP